jgi:hypothetical protein
MAHLHIRIHPSNRSDISYFKEKKNLLSLLMRASLRNRIDSVQQRWLSTSNVFGMTPGESELRVLCACGGKRSCLSHCCVRCVPNTLPLFFCYRCCCCSFTLPPSHKRTALHRSHVLTSPTHIDTYAYTHTHEQTNSTTCALHALNPISTAQ